VIFYGFPYILTMIEEIHQILDAEYAHEIGFIQAKSPYEHLIAVILSAQTTDRQVNLVTPELFEGYPTPAALSRADSASVEQLIHSVGFYRMKAKHIIVAAQVIHHAFQDQVPEAMEDLLSIPGVGRKSANVIRGACFGRPAVIVDTHFARVANRIGLVRTKNPDIIEREIQQKLDERHHYRFSMTVNLHGREICHAKRPQCSRCAVQSLCRRVGLP